MFTVTRVVRELEEEEDVRYEAQEGEPPGVRGDFIRVHIGRLASTGQSYDDDTEAKSYV